MSETGQYRCGECGTECEHAPGIGPYCPDQACDVGDGPGIIEIPVSEEELREEFDIERQLETADIDPEEIIEELEGEGR